MMDPQTTGCSHPQKHQHSPSLSFDYDGNVRSEQQSSARCKLSCGVIVALGVGVCMLALCIMEPSISKHMTAGADENGHGHGLRHGFAKFFAPLPSDVRYTHHVPVSAVGSAPSLPSAQDSIRASAAPWAGGQRQQALAGQPYSSRHPSVTMMSKGIMNEVGSGTAVEGGLSAERYIATNRFFVKEGKGPAFEKRWATRKSRLAALPGFNFFSLLRRVDPVPDEPNYVSFTVWDNVETFNSWRKGEAFKEAHGGGTLFGFVSMLVSSTRTLQGAPKPAFYNGLLPLAPPVESMPVTVNGWRDVEADGINTLQTEVFVAQNRFKITPGNEVAFEQRWKQRESKLSEFDGFMSFYMLRRDAPKADDGYNYVSTTFWRDRPAFEAWRASQTSSHGQGASPHGQGAEKPKAPPAMAMMKGPPSVAFYEGVLTLYSPDYNAKANGETQNSAGTQTNKELVTA